MHLNIVEDDLPEGDVCFVRQVFQHLSNGQIIRVLKKLKKYRGVYITEECPVKKNGVKPNLDKVHGADTRMHLNSGIFLSEAPFNLSKQALKVVLEVPYLAGVIRTILYKP